MSQRNRMWTIIIVVLAIVTVWIALPGNTTLQIDPLGINRDIHPRLGLDLSGGSQVLLEATDCTSTDIGTRLDNARQIIEKRVNSLGVSEPLVQIQGNCRIVVELPSIDDPAQAIALIQQTGSLEFVDVGLGQPPANGSVIRTSTNPTPTLPISETVTAPITTSLSTTATTPLTASTEPSATIPPSDGLLPSGQAAIPDTVYNVIMTGADLDPNSLLVQLGGAARNQPEVAFSLVSQQIKTAFAQFTTAHNQGSLGQPYYMCIVLDNVVQSCPSIQSPITDGSGVITVGSGGVDEANNLVNLLRYGALPVALQVAQSRTIGPTLGEDSIRASVIAGVIGLLAVALFMLLYYRLPGLLADLALMLYTLTVFSLFKLIPVTLTLPGIAGFILSVGVAVDANILIFERMKEELRGGRRLAVAVEVGFERAWPSIRDSNFSTLITCGILYWFGNAFGASIVKGFALTLAIGVLVSLFTAIRVTRTLLHLTLDNMNLEERHTWFGI
jgi:preprotein translocase subunit SecD